jgi:hypothetical protein
MIRVLVALALLFAASPSLADVDTVARGMAARSAFWRMDRTSDPYNIQINLSGVWYNFAQISGAGIFTPWSPARGGSPYINAASYLTSSGDQTVNLTAAQTALLSASPNGGVISLPGGNIDLCGFSIKSGVALRGQGVTATFIRQTSACNNAAVASDNYATFAGSAFCFDNGAGLTVPHGFTIENLSIFGNSAGNASGYALKVYGWGYQLKNVDIYDPTATGGFYSEFTDSGCGAPTDVSLSLEANLINFNAYGNLSQNGGTNVYFNGPHDSQWVSGGAGYGGSGVPNIRIGAKAFGMHMTSLHAWSAVASYNWYLEAPVLCANCIGDSAAATVGWMIGANGTNIDGGETYSTAASGASACFQIGDGTHLNISQVKIDTYTFSCNGSGGTVYFNSDAGNSSIKMVSYQASGSWYTGTPSSTTDWSLNLSGGAACYPAGPAGCPGQIRLNSPILLSSTLTISNGWFYQNTNLGGATPTCSQGLAFAWNQSNSSGENNFVDCYNGASGGFWFQTWNGSALTTQAKIAAGVQIGAPTGGYKGAGTINVATGIYANDAAGLSSTKTVRDAAGTGTCTLIFTMGLLTGGTC